MEIKTRFLHCGFIVVFMAMLILPLVFVDLSSNRVSVQENRMLADHPKLTDLKHHQRQFIRDFDAWFKDSTGFREQLLTLYNVVGKNKWLNGIRYTNGQYVFLVGEHGHHFVANIDGWHISRWQGKKILSDEQLENMANKLEEIKVYLDSKNIPLVVMFCADKESIYPEYYPKSIIRGPEPIQLDVITNYLKEHTRVDVFNIKQALLAEKDNYLLYLVSSGDFGHYTEIASFFAYRELMKHINKYFPDIVPYELSDIEITYDKKGLDGKLDPDVSLRTKNYTKLDSSFFNDVELIRPFIWENVAFENSKSDLPVILIFRDSFSGFYYETFESKFITQFIASHFGKAIFIHYNNLEHFEDYIIRYKPDIIVFEVAESALKYFPDYVISIPELVIPPAWRSK
jgi:hypothetical protein